jgi:hypothetical protein
VVYAGESGPTFVCESITRVLFQLKNTVGWSEVTLCVCVCGVCVGGVGV